MGRWGQGGRGVVVLEDSDWLVLMQYGVIESDLGILASFFSPFTQVTNSSIEVKSLGALHLTDERINVECNELPYI